MPSGGHNKKTIDQLKEEGTYREDRHGDSVVQDPKKAKAEPYILGQKLTTSEIYEHISNQLLAFSATEEVDGHYVSQMVTQYAILQEAWFLFQEDPQAKIGTKTAAGLITDAQRELRIHYAIFRVDPAQRSPEPKVEKSSAATLLEFVR